MAIKFPGFSFPALTFLISLLPYTLQLLAVGLGGILHLGDVTTIIKQEMAVDIFQLIHRLYILESGGKGQKTSIVTEEEYTPVLLQEVQYP